ncbi:hypothetical protein M9H77_12198 [Catharanthus roseus]|uniref:Uncharacterized protein n=1 Tax=Catharanthus roseus TaxID=4058 RepID=A0ACC0BGS1_CATRO|nr:hypothetical protein M9H77_12198 [Catharanthus roseus]
MGPSLGSSLTIRVQVWGYPEGLDSFTALCMSVAQLVLGLQIWYQGPRAAVTMIYIFHLGVGQSGRGPVSEGFRLLVSRKARTLNAKKKSRNREKTIPEQK